MLNSGYSVRLPNHIETHEASQKCGASFALSCGASATMWASPAGCLRLLELAECFFQLLSLLGRTGLLSLRKIVDNVPGQTGITLKLRDAQASGRELFPKCPSPLLFIRIRHGGFVLPWVDDIPRPEGLGV
jgi:hypothetical protein